jgi:tetratricopeptide (TPR) repeat protein
MRLEIKKIKFIPGLWLYLIIATNLCAQFPPITSSIGQKYPMPTFDLNKVRDTAYVNKSLKKAHFLLNEEFKKSNSLYKDSTILRIYNYFASVYRETKTNRDSALYYGKLTMNYARQKGNLEFQIKGIFQQALYFRYTKNNPEQALRLNLQAFNLMEKADHDPQVLWRICYNLGDLYSGIEDSENALKYYLISETLIQSGTGLSTVATEAYKIAIWQGIANLYTKKADFSSATLYFNKAIANLPKVSFKSNHANVFLDYSMQLYEEGKYNIAIEFAEKANAIFKELGDNGSQSITVSQLALYYYKINEFQIAEKLANEVILSRIKTTTSIRNAHKVLYLVNALNGNFEKSLNNFEKYIALNDTLEEKKKKEILYKIQSRFEIEKIEIKNLMDKELQQKEFDAVLKQNELEKLKSSLIFKRFLSEIENEKLKRQFETQLLKANANEQKTLRIKEDINKMSIINDLKINRLTQEKAYERKMRDALGIGFLIIAGLGFVLIYYNRRLSMKNRDLISKKKIIEEVTIKIAETEISALRSQMNPHFIFNCLNSIKLYSLENDSESASVYLTKFSKLIRLVLENSRTERLTLEKEIDTLQLYIEMEIMRFKEKVKYEIVISPEIDLQYVEIPPLLIQPFVENAIWHGLLHKEFGGKVSILINLISENMLEIQIIDNGIGREKSIEYKSKTATKHKSFGMKVTNERIDLINQIYKTKARVEIIDLFDDFGIGTGTKVIIQIPI